MIYVDENLCTGCGLCLDACSRGAISIRGRAVFIAENLCTSCGRCVDVCVTGAIIEVEPVENEALAAIEPRIPAAPLPQALTPQPAAPETSRRPAPRRPRLETLERVLSGVWSFVTFAYDLKQTAAARGDRRRPVGIRGCGEGRGRMPGASTGSAGARRGYGQGRCREAGRRGRLRNGRTR